LLGSDQIGFPKGTQDELHHMLRTPTPIRLAIAIVDQFLTATMQHIRPPTLAKWCIPDGLNVLQDRHQIPMNSAIRLAFDPKQIADIHSLSRDTCQF
jgi:hypothetical protein